MTNYPFFPHAVQDTQPSTILGPVQRRTAFIVYLHVTLPCLTAHHQKQSVENRKEITTVKRLTRIMEVFKVVKLPN